MSAFDWANDGLWQIQIHESEAAGFRRPYVGTGLVGTRFAELVIAPWSEPPLSTVTTFIYDGGVQLVVPAWNHLDLVVGGVLYALEAGTHRFTQTLDMRTGEVRLTDDWEYRPGAMVQVAIHFMLLRHLPHTGLLRISVDGLQEPAEVGFGLNGAHLANQYSMHFEQQADRIFGHYQTVQQKREVAQGICYRGADASEVLIENNTAQAVVRSTGPRLELMIGHSIHSDAHGNHPERRVESDLALLLSTPKADLRAENADAWRELWGRALAFEHPDPALTQMVLAHQFYLLGSLGVEARPHSALGVSAVGWSGCQFWDADLWIFRGVLPLWPELAEPIVAYRHKFMGAAQENAAAAGYRGAWFPWMSSEEFNLTSAEYRNEIHVGIWIALSAWEYFCATGDRVFLEKTAWPLVREVTEFFCSWAQQDAGGAFHIRNVIGPDEALTEMWHGTCDDHFTTVYGVKRLLEIAAACANEIGAQSPGHWAEIAERLYLPAADADGILPEFTGYDGKGIKQADLILSFYPLGYPLDRDSILRNLWYYHDKLMAYGPAMTTQIEACILLQAGLTEQGLAHLFDTMKEFVRGPHYLLYECRDNDNSVMLTAIGGELQALIYGYYGASIEDSSQVPRIGEAWGDAI